MTERIGEVAKDLRRLVEARGISHRQLAEKTGLTHTVVNRILSGSGKRIDFEKVERLYEALGGFNPLSSSAKRSVTFQDRSPETHIPLFGEIPAGPLLFKEGEVEPDDYIEASDLDPKLHFALKVHGSSMEPEYKEEDIVVCRRVVNVGMPVKEEGPVSAGLFSRYVGRVCAVLVDNQETTLKRIELEKTGDESTSFILMLRPLNPSHPTKVISAKNSCEIQGEVIRLIREV